MKISAAALATTILSVLPSSSSAADDHAAGGLRSVLESAVDMMMSEGASSSTTETVQDEDTRGSYLVDEELLEVKGDNFVVHGVFEIATNDGEDGSYCDPSIIEQVITDCSNKFWGDSDDTPVSYSTSIVGEMVEDFSTNLPDDTTTTYSTMLTNMLFSEEEGRRRKLYGGWPYSGAHKYGTGNNGMYRWYVLKGSGSCGNFCNPENDCPFYDDWANCRRLKENQPSASAVISDLMSSHEYRDSLLTCFQATTGCNPLTHAAKIKTHGVYAPPKESTGSAAKISPIKIASIEEAVADAKALDGLDGTVTGNELYAAALYGVSGHVNEECEEIFTDALVAAFNQAYPGDDTPFGVLATVDDSTFPFWDNLWFTGRYQYTCVDCDPTLDNGIYSMRTDTASAAVALNLLSSILTSSNCNAFSGVHATVLDFVPHNQDAWDASDIEE